MSEEIIQRCKRYIDEKNTSALQVFYQELPDLYDTDQLDWPRIFHRVFLHACLKGNEPIAHWMQNDLYLKLDPIQQIALRQIFPYGRQLLQRALKNQR